MTRQWVLMIFAAGWLAGIVSYTIGFPHIRPAGAHPAHAAQRNLAAGPTPASRANHVVIDPWMQQNMGVRTAMIEARSISEAIHTTGYVDYDQRRVSRMNARIGGWVQKINVAYVGQRVARGQTLFQIYSPELVLTEEDYLRSSSLASGVSGGEASARSSGDALMAAAETRLKLWGIPATEIDKLRQTRTPSQTVPVQATASGVVTDIKVVEGAHVRAGDDLYTIADLSRAWVYADIYERELPKTHVGQNAEIASDALPGKIFSGKVSYIYPSINEQSRTVRLRLDFDNSRGDLRPGMYVKVKLSVASPQQVLAVPAEAVLNSGLRRIVIVALGEGRFEPREIKIGPEASGYFQVLQGLMRGERIVTSAQFLIDSESNLNEALTAMTAGSHRGIDHAAATGPQR